MGIFRKLGDWITDKSDRFIRGGGNGNIESGYYATQEAQQAYGGMNEDGPQGEESVQPQNPFGHGEGEYGGRVPYRSRYDMGQQPQNAQPVQQTPQPQPQADAQAQGYQQQGNVVPFPGMQRGADGSVYAHVEYVVLLRSRNECRDVISYIKANASVFLNMEFIASDSERQRCVDMLSGAVYTLGCTLNKISPRGIYLISAPTVRVVLDPAMQKVASVPETQGFTRQRYDQEPAYREAPQPVQQPMQPPVQQPMQPPVQQPMQQAPQPQMTEAQEAQRPNGFGAGSPTTRFRAQSGTHAPSSFGSVMAGNATGMFPPVSVTGR